jgi:pyruvate/2-oxoglutarate dehydrogenase complex dihydrolipoamide acyltransferase (E2) component
MREAIIAPDLGSGDVVVSVWYVKPGETVFAGDRLVELLLGSATFDVPAPAAGTLIEQCVLPAERVVAGQVLGYLNTGTDGASIYS